MKSTKSFAFFNIYGFLLAVEGLAKRTFEDELSLFQVDLFSLDECNLIVRSVERRDLDTKLPWKQGSVYIPLLRGQRTLLYDVLTDPYFILSYSEPLFVWPKKTFLHAGAVSDGEKAHIFTGGSGVGKTSIILKLLSCNLRFISDDWMIVGEQGLAFPYSKKIRIQDYNITDDDLIRRRLMGKTKGFLIRRYLKVLKFLRSSFPNKTVKFLLHHHSYIKRVDVNSLYGNVLETRPLPIGKVFLMRKGFSNKILVREIDSDYLSYIMSRVSYYEYIYFYREYYSYLLRCLCPSRMNDIFEKRIQEDYTILKETFKGKEIYELILPKYDHNSLNQVLELFLEG